MKHGAGRGRARVLYVQQQVHRRRSPNSAGGWQSPAPSGSITGATSRAAKAGETISPFGTAFGCTTTPLLTSDGGERGVPDLAQGFGFHGPDSADDDRRPARDHQLYRGREPRRERINAVVPPVAAGDQAVVLQRHYPGLGGAPRRCSFRSNKQVEGRVPKARPHAARGRVLQSNLTPFMSDRSIRDLDLKGKRVFIRVDFNVPLQNNGGRRRSPATSASRHPCPRSNMRWNMARASFWRPTWGAQKASPIRR